MGPYFVVFAKELRGSRSQENSSLLKLGVGRPGAEVISAKGAGKAVDGGLGEGGSSRSLLESYLAFSGSLKITFPSKFGWGQVSDISLHGESACLKKETRKKRQDCLKKRQAEVPQKRDKLVSKKRKADSLKREDLRAPARTLSKF